MLSEQELLLLSNFMYADIPAKEDQVTMREILDKYSDNGEITANNVKEVTITGGMNREQMADIMNEMRKSDAIMQLKIEASIDDGIRGACFVNEDTGEATIAFRGTGGAYGQWRSNFDGAAVASVKEQEQAAEFVEQFKNYPHVVTTGHSKGGNLAMYAAIVLGSQVERCVSYEGQGFSLAFLQKYKTLIEGNKGKIVSISSSCDPVSALMFSVAGTKYCINTTNFFFSHSSYALYNEDYFDENGYFLDSLKTGPEKLIEKIGLLSLAFSSSNDHMNHLVRQLGVAVALGFELSGDKINNEKVKTVYRAQMDTLANWMQFQADKFMLKINFKKLMDAFLDAALGVWKKPEKSYPYVVRGAKIFCSRGSHFTYLDMPVSHGAYIRGKAMMNENDCEVGLDANIAPFGACSSPLNHEEEIIIHDTNNLLPKNIMGKLVMSVIPEIPVTGKLCTPTLHNKWIDAYEKTLVDGVPAITTACTITCAHNGVISFIDDGQMTE